MNIIHDDAYRVNYERTPAHPHITGNPITIRGRISGFYMERTREYYRRVEGSKHFLRKPPSITNDLGALAEAERLGADRVRMALPLAYWIKCAPDGTITQPTLPKRGPEPVADQPTLFDFTEPQRRGGAY